MINLKKCCECGCGAHISSPIGGQVISVYDEAMGEYYSIHRGHGRSSPKIATRNTWESAVRVATQLGHVILQEELRKLQTLAFEELDVQLMIEQM